MTSFSGSINLLEWLAELRETLNFTNLLKDMIKEQPGEEIHWARYGGKGVGLPCPLQVHHSPSISICSPT